MPLLMRETRSRFEFSLVQLSPGVILDPSDLTITEVSVIILSLPLTKIYEF